MELGLNIPEDPTIWDKEYRQSDPVGFIQDTLEEKCNSVDDAPTHLNKWQYNWEWIDFPTGVKIIVITINHNLYVFDGSFTEATQWVMDISDFYLDDYFPMPEENFWDQIGEQEYKVYHATTEDNINNIMKYGLLPKNKTRGITNRGFPAAIFASDTYEDILNYGDVHMEIDVGQMKADGYMPDVFKEEPVTEAKQRETIAWRIGLRDFCTNDEIYNDGIRESTVIFMGAIPPKYLKRMD